MKIAHFFLPVCLLLLQACASRAMPPDSQLQAWLERNSRPAEAKAYSDFLIGRFAALTNDPDTAARRYAAAISTAPSESGLAERAVFSALLSGDFTQAVRLSHKAAKIGSTASLVNLTLGTEALSRGDSNAARNWLDSGQYGPFNQMIARGISAWSVMDSEGAEAAQTYLRDGMTGEKRLDGAMRYQLGLIQLAAGEDEAALETFAEVWQGGMRLAIGAQAHARLLAVQGKRTEALALLDDFTQQVGRNAAVEALRREIASGAQIEVKRLTARQGAALAVYVPAAALMMQTSDDLSGVYFSLALALDPDLHVARTLWAQALENAGRRDEAIAILQNVPQSSPFYATARGQMAWALRREGRDEEALKIAGQALANQPDRQLKIQLADLYRTMKRYGEANEILSELIAADSKEGRAADWRLRYARGVVRERLGRWPQAESDLRTALALQPENASLLNYLGYSYIDRGVKLEAGFNMIRKAMQLNPASGFILDSLGWGHYKMGRYDLAVRFLERAATLQAGDPVINDHLGDAYWRTGRRLEARFQWQRALKLAPDESDRMRIEQKLETGLKDAAQLKAESR